MTVSRVINDSPRVSAETRRRVQASVAKLGYVPNRLARSLIQRRTGAFGVIVPDVANPFFTLIVRGVERVAWRAGYHVILCDTQGDLDRERGYLEDMVSFQVEGVLIAPVGDGSRPHLRLLTRNSDHQKIVRLKFLPDLFLQMRSLRITVASPGGKEAQQD